MEQISKTEKDILKLQYKVKKLEFQIFKLFIKHFPKDKQKIKDKMLNLIDDNSTNEIIIKDKDDK